MTTDNVHGVAGARPVVLVVDDEDDVARTMARAITPIASRVVIANDGADALQQLASEPIDVVVSDIHMPDMTGLELTQAVRERDLDVPIVLITGAPSVASAASALEVGAFRYLTKPIDVAALRECVTRAARTRELARTKGGIVSEGERASLEAAFRRALFAIHMVYQPIVNVDTHQIAGYEALLRCREPALPNPGAVIGAAEKLGVLHLLGRRVRALIGTDLERVPTTSTLYVNLHPADLADPDLYDETSFLSRHARRVVLELTERATLECVPEVDERLARLRRLGFRIAVDDLGAGYAGLTYFASVRPEIVKLDMSLVRGIDVDPVRQRVVGSLAVLARGLGMEIIAEGVETAAERAAVIGLGCNYVQGYLLAKPGPPYPAIQWS